MKEVIKGHSLVSWVATLIIKDQLNSSNENILTRTVCISLELLMNNSTAN